MHPKSAVFLLVSTSPQLSSTKLSLDLQLELLKRDISFLRIHHGVIDMSIMASIHLSAIFSLSSIELRGSELLESL